jgi:cation diffusion facilitator family transporter
MLSGKSEEDVRAGDSSAYAGRNLAAQSLGLNIVLTGVLFCLFFATGSSALLAQAVHSFTDVVGSLLVIGGVYLSGKKSEQFPWGLYKIENLVAVAVAGLIFLSAYEIAKTVYWPPALVLRNLDFTIVSLFLMALPIVLFSRYEARRARALNSPTLMADAESWKMDIAPLFVVAAGLLGARLSYSFLDRVSALLVLVLVVRAGYIIVRDSMKSLLDASVGKGTLDSIREVVEGFPQVKEIISLNARNSGRFIFVYSDVALSLKRLKDAHDVAVAVERKIKDRVPYVERVIIHYEPEKKDYLRYAVPLKNREGELSEHFGSAPYVGLWDERVRDGVLVHQEITENPFVDVEKGKGIRLAEFLAEKEVDVLYTKESFEGKGPQYVLSDAAVEVRITDLKSMKELIELSYESRYKDSEGHNDRSTTSTFKES